jgi:hypothetical protein
MRRSSVRFDGTVVFVSPPRWLVVLGAILLAALTFGSGDPPRIVEGHARELAEIRSLFVVTNDVDCRSVFCAVMQKELPQVTLAERAEDADALAVLTASFERESIGLPDTGGCAPCQAQAPPQKLDVEKRKVVLSVLVPTGPNEYRRILFTNASGGFGSNPDERLALQFARTWKKWAKSKR